MSLSPAEVGRRGRLDLTFDLQGGRTVLSNAYCEVPFKITRVLDSPARLPQLILMQCTAGLFGGDDVKCSIHVRRGARVRITQQSATKVHPSEDRVAVQSTEVRVDAGAELQLYLEPIIPFANCRLAQTTHLHVDRGGRLSFWEGFMMGRIGYGESWKFHEFKSETRLSVGGQSVYLDRFRLSPNDAERTEWTMGGSSYAGTGLYVSDASQDLRRFAQMVHDRMPSAGVDVLMDTASLVRVLSTGGPEFHGSRESFCNVASLIDL